jgi:hypothetical protein
MLPTRQTSAWVSQPAMQVANSASTTQGSPSYAYFSSTDNKANILDHLSIWQRYQCPIFPKNVAHPIVLSTKHLVELFLTAETHRLTYPVTVVNVAKHIILKRARIPIETHKGSDGPPIYFFQAGPFASLTFVNRHKQAIHLILLA